MFANSTDQYYDISLSDWLYCPWPDKMNSYTLVILVWLILYHPKLAMDTMVCNLKLSDKKLNNSTEKCIQMTFIISDRDIPLLRERINMLIKYCKPCQMNSIHKMEKCPHEITSIPIRGQVWSQIGMRLKVFINNVLMFNINFSV